MPKVSVNILTKNRAELLKKALASVDSQSFKDFELIVVDDASTDGTLDVLNNRSNLLIKQPVSKGITFNRQSALEQSTGEYIAILDDDDEWIDVNKLKKQVEFLDSHPQCVLVGGGIKINPKFKNLNSKQTPNFKSQILKFRPETDRQIRQTMLYRNNFFTSTVMFRRQAAVRAGGFILNGEDLAEDYDLWLRLGNLGQMYNFQEPFAAYRVPDYNKLKHKAFLQKQLRLIIRGRFSYPGFWAAGLILKFRLLI